MAKAQGIIGNFKGKIGNTVGYQLTSSNNKQTQGIRIYQPNVKNPKTSAQAEQRAKLLAVNGTYRALKNVIDRGNEGLPYGNKSRLAWLKKALKAEGMPWFVKGSTVSAPVLCEISRGSLASIAIASEDDSYMKLPCAGIVGTETKVGQVATAILASYHSLQAGDQLTAVMVEYLGGSINGSTISIVLDPDSNDTLPEGITVEEGSVGFPGDANNCEAGCLIVSREGANGEHLRSTESLHPLDNYREGSYASEAKAAAIESYMAASAANTDWAEESIG